MESGHTPATSDTAPQPSHQPSHQACHTNGSSCSGGRVRSATFVLGSILCCSLAMFIWMKLRVVTNVPRTAYAEPESKLNGANTNAGESTNAASPTTPSGAGLSDGSSGSPIFERP